MWHLCRDIVHTCTQWLAWKHTYTHASTHWQACSHTHLCTHTCVHWQAWRCIHTWAHIHTLKHTVANIYTYSYTCIVTSIDIQTVHTGDSVGRHIHIHMYNQWQAYRLMHICTPTQFYMNSFDFCIFSFKVLDHLHLVLALSLLFNRLLTVNNLEWSYGGHLQMTVYL